MFFFYKRLFIWKSILRLPENHIAFGMLADKGIHSSFANIHEKFPIKSQKLLRMLQKWVFLLFFVFVLLSLLLLIFNI